MTLFDLAFRSMRKNIKHYYLYFFALIFSVVLYFVFATLQHDPAVLAQNDQMSTAFLAAGILLIFIAGIFVVYANSIFLKRRSREIGLYQLIGLKKRVVARLLIFENFLLGIAALVLGIAVGMLVSRVFLLLLMKLIGYEMMIDVSFSMTAVIQTVFVFIGIFMFTTIQMISTVYRNTLLSLFNTEKTGEHPKKPKTRNAAFLAILGIALIVLGYIISNNMLNDLFLFNILAVLASIGVGTYLIFRVTIGWVFYKIRDGKSGHLGLSNSLSLAPLMHRLKANANSLTIITILSAMTLTMLAGAYSFYYATEHETRSQMPFDFIFEKNEAEATELSKEFDEQGISHTHGAIDLLVLFGQLEEGAMPIPSNELYIAIVSDKQLQQAGSDIEAPKDGSALFYSTSSISLFRDTMEMPVTLHLADDEKTTIEIAEYAEGNSINGTMLYSQLVVDEKTYEHLKNQLLANGQAEMSRVDGFTITDSTDQEAASDIYVQRYNTSGHIDYYSAYQRAIETNGLLIFISGFLGLVFLISTGSILYFKQMTEAEQERKSYGTLRQLGFSVKDIMRGIVKKQLFVFGLPLVIGLLHAIFAIKVLSSFFQSDIAFAAFMAMAMYTLIYLVFAFLTVGYYRKTVKNAL